MTTSRPTASIVPVRSDRGCWTCRLRKKKCGEEFPGCVRCASVNIKCYYGPRPEWIDHRARGKEELDRIKAVIAASASRKRAAFRARARLASLPTQIPESPNHHQSYDQILTSASDGTHSTDSKGSPTAEISRVEGDCWEAPAANHHKWVEDHEASLMMHYLDHVFFIQFRFYTPPISAGGRGWLLSLLIRTKPLYHAALSLSAFHQQSLLDLGNGSDQEEQANRDYLQALERHHNLTLKELQLFIQVHSEKGSSQRMFDGNVEILACMVQLISFELFNGGDSNWQVHLRAASELILILHGIFPRSVDQTTKGTSSSQSVSSPKTFCSPSPNNAALNFFTGAIVWMDILACISTGSRPYLSEDHHLLLTSPTSDDGLIGKIELHIIVGCQNWALVIIGEIARLNVRKQAGNLNADMATEAAKDIQLRLSSNGSEIQSELDTLCNKYAGAPPPHRVDIYHRYTTLTVTQTFACAALIYLQTVIPSNSFSTQTALKSAIAAMSMIPDPRMFRGLVWPLCVAGCTASSSSDQNFFRKLATDAIKDSRRFGNSGKALEILEKSWEMQKEKGRVIDCATAIKKLGTCVLLV